MRTAALAVVLVLASACSSPPKPSAPVAANPRPPDDAASRCPADVTRAHVPTEEERRSIPNAIVRAVCVVGVGPDATRTASAIIGVKEHAPLVLQQVMKDTHALMDNGSFDDVVVAAVPRDGQVVVVYQLRERKRLAELVVEGADDVAAERVTLKRGAPVAPWDIGRASTALRQAYAERGQHGAKVETSVEPIGDGVRVRFVVVPGPKWTFGSPTVIGATKIPTEKLVEAASETKGKPFDETQMNRTTYLVERVYNDHGWLDARVRVERGTPGPDGVVPLALHVESEGPQFKVTKVSVDKLDPEIAKAVRGKLRTKSGQLANVATMIEDTKTIEKLYDARGTHAEISFAVPHDAANGTAEVSFEKLR